MPGVMSPARLPSSQKQQQSISSFFTSKPVSQPQSSTTTPPTQTPSNIIAPERSGQAAASQARVIDGWDEDDLEGRSYELLSRSSHFKRALSNGRIGDDHDGAKEPPPKRQRTQTEEVIEEIDKRHASIKRRQPDGESAAPACQATQSQAAARTSKYMFSSTPPGHEEDEEEDKEVTRQKEQLHQRFVKKLGRPDAIAEIKRRNHFLEEAVPGEDDVADEAEAEEEPEPKAAVKGKRGAAAKKGGSKLTPMEKQVIEIKRQHMDAVLVVEVGYKFKFFGEDARTAAKELSIVCIPGKFRFDEHPSEAHLDRFASASVPVHRLHVHVKRLVAAGHKVGVVRQLETAALKAAGDNRNAPFVRKLTNLYTKGTYVDDIEGLNAPTAGPSGGAPATGHLLCLTETNAKGWGTDEKVHVGIVAVQPATGDIIYDDFEDGFMRTEIETRLLHIAPCEFLIVGDVSKATEKLVQHLSGSKTNVFGDKARVERVEKPKTMAAQSSSHISNFYADKLKSTDTPESALSSNVLDKVHKLSEHVTICLSAMITHLIEYGLEHVFDLTKNFQAFSARSHMLLNGNTLNSLEIYRNQTDQTEKGSLFWVLDQTQTRFGKRLLRKWVGRPLLDKARLEERIRAVEELKAGDRTIPVDKIKHMLLKTKIDLEKSLIRIYYKKCTRPELLSVLQTLQTVGTEFAHVNSVQDAGFKSNLLNEAIAVLPKILDDVVDVLDKINPEAARTDDKYGFFREEQETNEITEHRVGIASVDHDLNMHRKEAAQKVRKTKVDYVTVAGIDFLIEIDNSDVKNVPASWAKISGTKKVSRFHTPEVVRFIRERDQHKEALAAACDDAFIAMLSEISTKYQAFRDCIQSLATLDCLLSFAEVANRPNYVKPTFTAEPRISVKGGRHPMVEQLLLDAYVPNDVSLFTDTTRALLITGPNMGGKSSYVRSVALICIMAQCGSYVPAAAAELGMLDAVFTRMGAFDNMMAGESTFMVELSETSDILKQATPRSLIILDELGRGTSTHDGVAIAHAVLEHIVRATKSLLLFITHYQSLSTVANGFPAGELRNVHMRFEESGNGENDQDITFLYEIGEGVAHRSYGLNVARLANVPKDVIEVASVRSKEMEMEVQRKKLNSLADVLGRVVGGDEGVEIEALVEGIEQL